MGLEDDRQKAIDAAVSQIERMCGKGAIMRLGEGANVEVSLYRAGLYRSISRWVSEALRGAAS